MAAFVSGAHFVAVMWLSVYCTCFKVHNQQVFGSTSLEDPFVIPPQTDEKAKKSLTEICPVSLGS